MLIIIGDNFICQCIVLSLIPANFTSFFMTNPQIRNTTLENDFFYGCCHSCFFLFFRVKASVVGVNKHGESLPAQLLLHIPQTNIIEKRISER